MGGQLEKVMFMNLKLKKMGYGKGELNDMKIEQIIKLGDMGYSKEEIEAMQKEPENDITAQLESLKNQIENLTKQTQTSNVRGTVTDAPNLQDEVDKGLQMLAGGNVNGGEESK